MPNYTATLNRFEVKYLVSTRQVPALLAALAEFTTPDPHQAGDAGYGIFSVYWDTANWSCFWEKVEGLKYRRKLRFRRYLGSDRVFLEVKQREDRTLQKRRVAWPVERVLAAFPAAGGPDWDLVAADPVATEAALMIDRLRLRPRMAILYRRRALFGAFDPELRITLDSRIQYSVVDLDVSRPFETSRYGLDPRVTVLEVKYNHRAPIWFGKLARRHQLSVVRMSKYCSAVDRAFFGHQLT
jgi:hypothetical protein